MSKKTKLTWFFASVALCMCFMLSTKISAAASVTLTTSRVKESVHVSINEASWNNQKISIVLYSPGYDASAKTLKANEKYVSYIGFVSVSGQTGADVPLKGNVEDGEYTIVFGTKAGKVFKTFKFDDETPIVVPTSPTTPTVNTPAPTPGTVATTVSLKKPSIKVKAGKRCATVSWKKDSKANGYKVYMATKKKGKYKVVATVKKNKTIKAKIKKLKKGKTYYFKVKAYQTINGKKVEGKASAIKSVKVK